VDLRRHAMLPGAGEFELVRRSFDPETKMLYTSR